MKETPIDSKRGISFSPRKIKINCAGLFKKAHHIESAETYLTEKTYKLSKTNESSSPPGSTGQNTHL
jgi:hypothetical protein